MENIRLAHAHRDQCVQLRHIRLANLHNQISMHCKYYLINYTKNFIVKGDQAYVKNNLTNSPIRPRLFIDRECDSHMARNRHAFPFIPNVAIRSSTTPYKMARSPPWKACRCCSGNCTCASLASFAYTGSLLSLSSVERLSRRRK